MLMIGHDKNITISAVWGPSNIAADGSVLIKSLRRASCPSYPWIWICWG